jgi:23S rRNA (cytidine1920-2'-O)/16S rRNA (cytidine1409-2'-O)-methyltransferase
MHQDCWLGLIILGEVGYNGPMLETRPRLRLDQWLVEHQLAVSRSRARDLILRGTVTVEGKVCLKPGQLVGNTAKVAIAGTADAGAHYVSRGALKLIAALDHFGIDPQGKTALDIGASTGGFTQVLLERGAKTVTAVDVGQSQLAASLRQDTRVHVLESQDARGLDRGLVLHAPEIVTADVSFISLTLALPAALGLAEPGAHLVALIKPQFEAGRAAIGKGGIVRSEEDRDAAVNRVHDWIGKQAGWRVLGVIPSPIQGKSGNAEFLLAAIKDEPYSQS